MTIYYIRKQEEPATLPMQSPPFNRRFSRPVWGIRFSVTTITLLYLGVLYCIIVTSYNLTI